MRGASAKAGFSLLEMLVVLAIMALGATLVVTRAAGAIAQATDHAVFFDFQRQVSDLRRTAFRDQTPLVIQAPATPPQPTAHTDPAQAPLAPVQAGVLQDGSRVFEAALRPGWTYTLSQPLRMQPSGRCERVTADLVKDGKSRVHLVSGDDDCHFVRIARAPG